MHYKVSVLSNCRPKRHHLAKAVLSQNQRLICFWIWSVLHWIGLLFFSFVNAFGMSLKLPQAWQTDRARKVLVPAHTLVWLHCLQLSPWDRAAHSNIWLHACIGSLDGIDESICVASFLKSLPKTNSVHSIKDRTKVNKYYVKWHVLFSSFLLYLL